MAHCSRAGAGFASQADKLERIQMDNQDPTIDTDPPTNGGIVAVAILFIIVLLLLYFFRRQLGLASS